MNVEKIEKLEEVLLHLGPDQKIKDYKLTRLTAPGENYGSLMLRLQLKVFDEKTKSEQDLELVAKMLPPNDLLREVFNIQVTFRNEANLYSTIIPALEEFQRRQGAKEIVDIFPKYYGSRFSMDEDNGIVDDGAILLLENLQPTGYTTGNRRIGFDLETAKLITKNLAYFHAIPLALKLTNPDEFEKKIKPNLQFYSFVDENVDQFTDNVINAVKDDPICAPHLGKIKKLMDQNISATVHEPFATMIHNDFWVNNMLIKYEAGKPVGVKMVDFQVIDYRCPCRDVIFFLFSSIQLDVIKKHSDDLIDLYYTSFIEKLEELKCDTTAFSREAFDKQMKLAVEESEYYHLAIMTFPLYADPNDVKELSDMAAEDFAHSLNLSTECKAKLLYITSEFVKRGWL